MPRRPDPKRRGGSPQRPPSAGATPPAVRRSQPARRRRLRPGARRGVPRARDVASGRLPSPSSRWRSGSPRSSTSPRSPRRATGPPSPPASPPAWRRRSPPTGWATSALPLVIAFAFMAGALSFIGANSIEVGPMPNMAITMLGIVWIGVLGSYAALILRVVDVRSGHTVGHRHAGAGRHRRGGQRRRRLLRRLRVRQDAAAPVDQPATSRSRGSSAARSLTLVVMLVIGMQDLSDTWTSTGHLLMLGDRDLDHGAARRPDREHVQAQPRREGLRRDHPRPRRRARPLRRVPVHAAGRVLPDAGGRTVGGGC